MPMKNFFAHSRKRILTGIFAIIPVVLAYLVIKYLYIAVDRKAYEYVDQYIGFRIPGLGIILVILILYFTGMVASNVTGKRLFSLFEGLMNHIPVVSTMYQVGKQISTTLSLPEKQVFKRAVLVEVGSPGFWGVGFVTGTLQNEKTKESLLRVFVPTVPNPTTGFVIVVSESKVIDPGWSIEDMMKTIISGGIIGPDKISTAKA